MLQNFPINQSLLFISYIWVHIKKIWNKLLNHKWHLMSHKFHRKGEISTNSLYKLHKSRHKEAWLLHKQPCQKVFVNLLYSKFIKQICHFPFSWLPMFLQAHSKSCMFHPYVIAWIYDLKISLLYIFKEIFLLIDLTGSLQ